MASRTGGGAATAGGMQYQHRVAAWATVRILAEEGATPPWNLSASTILDAIRCETGLPVDDVLVTTSGGGRVLIQAKRRLDLSAQPHSELAGVFSQFVQQSRASHDSRPHDPNTDRLVLATSSHSPTTIRVALLNVFNRARALLPTQALAEAATNEQERNALGIAQEHIHRAWVAAAGSEPLEQDVRRIVALIWVHVLDVDPNGRDEDGAKVLLRNAVLWEALQADLAWSRLIEHCQQLAARRSGADRVQLQEVLGSYGIALQSVRSVREDIRRLKTYTQTTAHLLRDLSIIRVERRQMRLRRPVTADLRRAAEEGSILVVGEPGAGKSGVLFSLAEALHAEKRDVLYIAADRTDASSLGTLQGELGLSAPLAEIIARWDGPEPAFLVIDALDAVRSASASTALHDLMLLVQQNARWRIVASIRKFDLRYSNSLASLFRGIPPTGFQDREFEGTRHINVPLLAAAERLQIESQNPALYRLLVDTSPELSDLLGNLFNLRILAELLDVGLEVDQLLAVTSQSELLDRYWSYRVVRDDTQGDAREATLRSICCSMVTNRLLQTDRATIADGTTSASLDDLLSHNVLVEWQPRPEAAPDRYTLSFRHNILFDYATARLMLPRDTNRLVQQVESDTELVVVARPSFVFFLDRLWRESCDHQAFWDLVLAINRHTDLPELAKVLGPSLAADMIRAETDLQSLYAALESDDGELSRAAEHALRHLVGSLLVDPARVLTGAHSGPWCSLLRRALQVSRVEIAYAVRPLFVSVCNMTQTMTPDQKDAAGSAARRFLRSAWSGEAPDRSLIAHGLEAVCRTFATDVGDATALIRRTIEPARIGAHGFAELPCIAGGISHLTPHAPELVRDIYCAAFSHEELSSEPVPMGTGRIIGMMSNRRQDYQMATYQLARAYPKFVAEAPAEATQAIASIVTEYVARRHDYGDEDLRREDQFEFFGRPVRIRQDFSSMWDEGATYRHDEPLEMLDAWERYVESRTDGPDGVATVVSLIETVTVETSLAVMWRRILDLGARRPEAIGRAIRSLAWTEPVLAASDTAVPLGGFLRAVYPLLTLEERRQVETAILALPNFVSSEHGEWAECRRNQLLGCLARQLVATNEAKRILTELQKSDDLPPVEPSVHVGALSGRPTSGDVIGMPDDVAEREENRRIREMEQPIKEFSDKHLNGRPTHAEASALLEPMRALRQALTDAERLGVPLQQRDYVWGTLADACERVVRIQDLECDDELGAFVRAALLEASENECPQPNPRYDTEFDRAPCWGTPSPRTSAAAGLTAICRHASSCSSAVRSAVERLSADPVPCVRHQIAQRLCSLYRTANDTMWRLIDSCATAEQSRSVLHGLVHGTLAELAGTHPDHVSRLVILLLERVPDGECAKELHKSCRDIIFGLYIWRDHRACREAAMGILESVRNSPDVVDGVLFDLRPAFRHGPVVSLDPERDTVRARAWDTSHRMLRCAWSGLGDLEDAHRGIPFESWPERDTERAKGLLQLIDTVAMELRCLANLADDEEQEHSEQMADSERDVEQHRFYREAGSVIDELAEIGVPSVVHHLLEVLEKFIPHDPRGVLLRMGRALQAGKQGGYQYESLGVSLFVRMVQRYLAEYRHLLREDADCRRTLLEALEVFVSVGWPDARSLTYRLHEIFR